MFRIVVVITSLLNNQPIDILASKATYETKAACEVELKDVVPKLEVDLKKMGVENFSLEAKCLTEEERKAIKLN